MPAETIDLAVPRAGGAAKAHAGTQEEAARLRRIVIVTGMSGAGKSTALKALEDAGYEAVDNLPLSLLGALAPAEGMRAVAIGVDARTRDFDARALVAAGERLSREGACDVKLLFLDCEDEELRRRFTQTRRRHPLAADRPVADGIRAERVLLRDLVDRADLAVDTSTITQAELKRIVLAQFALAERPALAVSVVSFSYRHGLPREADLVFDVRFLANPHYDPVLQPQTGQDAPVGAFIARDPGFAAFFEGLTGMLASLLPRYEAEGKSYLTVAIGCTGGRHRSVYVAERLAGWLQGRGRAAALTHRDLGSGRGAA
jgi:UPF0042 nucleotide-binding protein